MSNLVNSFIDIALRSDFPLIHWLFYNTFILYVLYIMTDTLAYELKNKNYNFKIIFKPIICILVILIILICLCIFDGDGIYIYICALSIVASICIICMAVVKNYKVKNIKSNKNNKKEKKPKKQKVKFEKKNSLNFTNVKLKNKNLKN